MRGPKPPRIELTDAERQALEELVRRHRTAQQIALRARIVLTAAEGYNNAQIARQLGVSIDTVRLWRERWLILQPASLEDLPVVDRFSDVPRPGKPPTDHGRASLPDCRTSLRSTGAVRAAHQPVDSPRDCR